MTDLDSGHQIGPYEVLREIGRGGMGVVYLARDTKLDRDVAVKALPEELAEDEDRLARFEREAKTLASLNHPNIGAIYGLEEVDGRRYLILEYIEGETLAERLAHGPLPTDVALDIGLQIAGAVEAAHEKGVVHRDLKPANITLTTGADGDVQVKVLDFGLAKALGDEAASGSSMANSPTVIGSPTIAGVVLGTAGYLSPEQARGRPVDKRTDIFAFGCVLYEMLTGEGSFGGETVTDSIAATIHKDPEWDLLPPETPPLVRHLLKRCLAKDRRQRLHDIADARIEIEHALAAPFDQLMQAGPTGGQRSLVGPVLTTAIACLLIGAVVTWAMAPQASRGTDSGAAKPLPVHFEIDASSLGVLALPEESGDLVVSRDGRRIVFEYWSGDASGIAYRDVGSEIVHPIDVAAGGFGPFLSPDGQSVGFWRENKLWRAAIAGGPATSICDAPMPFGPVAWLDMDQLVFVHAYGADLSVVDVSSGATRRLARTDRTGPRQLEEVQINGYETVFGLPGDRGLLASVYDGNSIEDYDIVHVAIDSGTLTHVLDRASHPSIIGDDILVFLRDSSLLAARFDLASMQLVSEPVLVHQGVRAASWGGTAQYAIGQDGTLAYIPGRRVAESRQLVRVNREGEATPIGDPDAVAGHLDIAPDGQSIAIVTLRRQIEIWHYDLERRILTLISNVGESSHPLFTPDGSQVLFQQISGEDWPRLVLKRIGVSEEPRIVFQDRNQSASEPLSWSPLGDLLLLRVAPEGDASRQDIVVFNPESGDVPRPLIRSIYDEDYAEFSPDGKWVVLDSDESGRDEVFVTRFPSDGRKWQVSVGGGWRPRWSPDGSEIFYLNSTKLTVASFDAPEHGPPVIGEPETLFDLKDKYSHEVWDVFDVFPNGDFLMVEPAPWEKSDARLNVIVNWGQTVRSQLGFETN